MGTDIAPSLRKILQGNTQAMKYMHRIWLTICSPATSDEVLRLIPESALGDCDILMLGFRSATGRQSCDMAQAQSIWMWWLVSRIKGCRRNLCAVWCPFEHRIVASFVRWFFFGGIIQILRSFQSVRRWMESDNVLKLSSSSIFVK